MASVFVVPQARGTGIGQALVGRVVEEAASLKVPAIHLFTAEQVGFYEKLGWESWQQTKHHGRDVTIMRRRLGIALKSQI